MASIIPTAIAAGIWYHLAQQGLTTTTILLGCNLLDTLRALRLIRPNGRAVGQRTRRKAMRDSLISWISFVTIQQFGTIPDKLLGWLPVYSLMRTLIVVVFLFARASASETIYNSFIQPALKRYETHIDLTIELVSSISLLVYHFTLQYPLLKIRLIVESYISKFTSSFLSAKGVHVDIPPSSIEELIVTPTDTDVDAQQIPKGVETVRKVAVDPLAGESKIRHLIAECEKRSPLRPQSAERGGRPRSQLSRAPDAQLMPERSSLANVPAQITRRAPPPTSTVREPSRPITTRPTNDQSMVSRVIPRQPAVQRTAPTVKDANVRADPPIVKSKSINNLKPKPYITDIIPTRPTKSAPTRRTAIRAQATEGPNSPRAKKLAHAAERAKEIRERRRREPGPTPGKKRPPPVMSEKDGPGSKRTRITVAKD